MGLSNEIKNYKIGIAASKHIYNTTDRDEMNNLYRGPYIDAAYQVSAHLT